MEVLAFLFPPVCLACARVEGNTSLELGICGRCRSNLQSVAMFAGPAAQSRFSGLDGLVSGWSYEPPLDAVIHGLKFGRLEYLGHDLADALHRKVGETRWEIDVVVPIPLHWHRRMARGYNQAEAIARPFARRLGVPLVHALRRRRATGPQARLDRLEREINLRLAFAPRRPLPAKIARKSIALVDDVFTTGSTLEAAARCLRDQGASHIFAVTAAKTPGDGKCQMRKKDRGQSLLL